MDGLTQKLSQEFDTCREHTYHIKDDIIVEYYEDISQFKNDRDLFFSAKPEKIEQFYSLEYPFKGHEVFDEKKFMNLVDIVPEFIVSLIKKRMESVLTLPKYQNVRRFEPVMLSLNNMREASQIVYHSWNLLLEIYTSRSDSNYDKLKSLRSLLELLQTGRPQYDILGLLQNIYNSIIIMGNSIGFEGFDQFKPVIHQDPIKREALYSIAGRELLPLWVVNNLPPKSNREDVPAMILNSLLQDGYPQLNAPSQYFIQEPGVPYSPPDDQNVEVEEETELLNTRESSLAIKLAKLKTPFITRNKSLLNSLVTLQPIIDSKMKILISGQTGTGKDVLANAIHQMSKRKGVFIAINCASITGSLFESEIFGHVKGAFTGAIADKKGAFELADGGTLFLDEIGDLPIDQQAKLLRAVESNTFIRVGGQEEIEVDVRVISATHIDLEKQVEKKLFREDLYSRINGISVDLIPLNDRKEDVPLIAEVLFVKYAKIENVKVPRGMTADTFLPLSEKSWPRNVRQLDNHIHRIVAIFKQSNQSLNDLKSLLKDDDIDIATYTDLVFTGPTDLECFDAYIQTGCSINKTWKKLGSSKDTMTKIIYGIFVRLLTHTGDVNASISYLIDQSMLHKEDTQAFEVAFKSVLEPLKNKISENKSLERQLYTDDEQKLKGFLNKV
ncbi:MAG: sigma-54-dependent Fis family transcriptional regulator [Candidatus Brocadiales bacterium]|nr:sigma-54-dependent Fis family transcriptional regulator [Candidatus Brocadiales bacterium]